MRKGVGVGGGGKDTPLSLHIVNLQSLQTVEKEEERRGTKEGGRNTNQRQNTDLSHSPTRSLVDFHCSRGRRKTSD